LTRHRDNPEAWRHRIGRPCGVIVTKLLECDTDHIVLSNGSRIVLPDGMSASQFPLGTGLAVVYAVRDGKKVADSIERSEPSY